MKKFLLSTIALIAAIAANAATAVEETVFQGKLAITLDGTVPDMKDADDATITVSKMDDGTYTLVLNQFKFAGELIGDATVSDIKGEEKDGGVVLSTTDKVAPITNGGPLAEAVGNKVVMTMTATMKDGKLNADISKITVNMLGTDISVKAAFESTSSTTGINAVNAATSGASRVYDLSGRQLPAMQKGLNIVKTAGGKTVKVVK